MKKCLFLSPLIFSLSCFSSEKNSSEEEFYRDSPSKDDLYRYSDQELNFIASDFREIDFNTIVESFKDRKLITINKEEYVVLQKEPNLKTQYCKDKLYPFARANPCYKGGLGPNLLKERDIKNLPKSEEKVDWRYWNIQAVDYMHHTFITVRYRAYNNPHWINGPFLTPTFPEEPYWNAEPCPYSTQTIYSVNFLLQKIESTF